MTARVARCGARGCCVWRVAARCAMLCVVLFCVGIEESIVFFESQHYSRFGYVTSFKYLHILCKYII